MISSDDVYDQLKDCFSRVFGESLTEKMACPLCAIGAKYPPTSETGLYTLIYTEVAGAHSLRCCGCGFNVTFASHLGPGTDQERRDLLKEAKCAK